MATRLDQPRQGAALGSEPIRVRRYAGGRLNWGDVGLPRLRARNDDEVAWWLRKSGADHYAEHLDRLREWQAELLARRSRGVVDE